MNIDTQVQDLRLSDGLALMLIVITFAIGVIAYEAVPAEMVVHYTPPGGVYYGPETLPESIGLFIVPVVTAIIFVILRALPVVGNLNEELAAVRPYYQLGIVLLVAFLLGVQMVLVLLNVI